MTNLNALFERTRQTEERLRRFSKDTLVIAIAIRINTLADLHPHAESYIDQEIKHIATFRQMGRSEMRWRRFQGRLARLQNPRKHRRRKRRSA